MHVAGVIVRARPGQTEAARQIIQGIDGADIHGGTEEGKLVVTLLGDTRKHVADTLMGLESIQPVLSATLVYEESDSDFFGEESKQ